MEKNASNGAVNTNDQGVNYKVKLMCSYGGKIHHRPIDHHQLAYVGGDTKILTVDRTITFSNLIVRLHSLCDSNSPFCLKYQLPGEDLDVLISVFDDSDLENMMFEYDRVHRISSSSKPARFRLFIFFSVARLPPASATPDFLFGFDKEYSFTAAGDGVANTTSNSDVSKNPDKGLPENVGSDQAEIPKPKQIQGIEARSLPDAYARDSSTLTRGVGAYAYAAPVPAPLFYRIPVPAATGYYQIGQYGGMQPMERVVRNREQPVYTFVPVFPHAQEQQQVVSPTEGHVTSDGFVAGAMQSTAPMVATSNHESNKVSPQA